MTTAPKKHRSRKPAPVRKANDLLRAFGSPLTAEIFDGRLRVEDRMGEIMIDEVPAFSDAAFVERLSETIIGTLHAPDRASCDTAPVIRSLAVAFEQSPVMPDAAVPALTHSRQIALVTAVASTEERLAREMHGDPSAYFTPDVNARSIFAHFGYFKKEIGDLYVLAVDQTTENFARYLTAKAADTPTPAQLRRYVADKTLVATYGRNELLNESARRRVSDIVSLRKVLVAVAQLHSKATREFMGRIESGAVDLESLPRAAVEAAFAEMKPILIERVSQFAIGAQ
jgi:hypothetical protein